MPKIRGKQLEDGEVTATQADTTNGTISTVNAGDAAVEGSGTGLSRRDHQHAVATGTPGAVQVGDTAAEGSASDLVRSDHTHGVTAPSAPADVTKEAAAAGTSQNVARQDHKHDITTGAAVELAEANAEGDATTLARSNHTHDHGDRSGGSLHAAATTSVNGFMSSADKTKLDAAENLSEIDAKESCRVRAQGDLDLDGDETLDGIDLDNGDRVLADQQATGSQDGIYIVNTAGAWSRSADMPTATEARGVRVWIEQGTVDGARLYSCSNVKGSDIVGTDGLTFGLIGAGSPRGAGVGLTLNGNDLDVNVDDTTIEISGDNLKVKVIGDTEHGDRGGGTLHADAVAAGADGFMTGADKTKLDNITALAEPNDTENQEIVATQVITGSDTAITDQLDNVPISAASVSLFLNGVHQKQGATFDYTISGQIITWLASSGTAVDMDTNDVLIAVYWS